MVVRDGARVRARVLGEHCEGSLASPATLRVVANFGKISAKCCSFSAVSAPIFASKYAFYSIFQNLPDYLAAIFEI